MKRMSPDSRSLEAHARVNHAICGLVERFGTWNAAKIECEMLRLLKARRRDAKRQD
jgi:hypothetical protein